jgi:inhibitor of the pro-sigma K processing machinery
MPHVPMSWLLGAGALAAVLVVSRLTGLGLGGVVGVALRLLGGGVVLGLVDLVGARLHFTLAINPVSAALVGFLGVPGLLLLGALHALFL